MKNLFLLFFFIPFVEISAQGIKPGFSIGLNSARVSTNFKIVSDVDESILGLQAGVFFPIPISSKLKIEPQLNYNTKGLYFKPSSHSHTVIMHSLDLPIYMRFELPWGLFAGLGPDLGYYLSGKNTADFGTKKETHSYQFNGDPFEYKRIDLGFNIMVGYMHSSGVLLRAAYSKGLLDVAELPENTWKSNILSISAGYQLNSITSKSINK